MLQNATAMIELSFIWAENCTEVLCRQERNLHRPIKVEAAMWYCRSLDEIRSVEPEDNCQQPAAEKKEVFSNVPPHQLTKYNPWFNSCVDRRNLAPMNQWPHSGNMIPDVFPEGTMPSSDPQPLVMLVSSITVGSAMAFAGNTFIYH